MEEWKETLDWILKETEGLHCWYSYENGWCFITDGNRERHRIDHMMTPARVKKLLLHIQLMNYSTIKYN